VNRTTETGSWLAYRFQGRGIGTAMRRVIAAFAFDHLLSRGNLVRYEHPLMVTGLAAFRRSIGLDAKDVLSAFAYRCGRLSASRATVWVTRLALVSGFFACSTQLT
jgi:hypothetical protein